MRIGFLLLSVMFFVLLALDFSAVNSPTSPSVSAPIDLADKTLESTPTDVAAPVEAPPSQRPVKDDVSTSVAASPVTESATKKAEIPIEPAPQTPQSAAYASVAAHIEAEVFRLSNIERTKLGLDALTLDETLASTARAHSNDMIARDFFDHNNPDDCSSACRATAAGYRWRMIGENIHMMSGWDLSPLEAAIMIVNGWMSSPGHRENLLKPGYEETGIGIVVEGDAVYSTALYGTQR